MLNMFWQLCNENKNKNNPIDDVARLKSDLNINIVVSLEVVAKKGAPNFRIFWACP